MEMEQKFSLCFYQAAILGSSYHFQGVSISADSSLTYPAGGAPSAALSTQAKTSHYICWSRIFQTSQKGFSGYGGGTLESPEPHSSFIPTTHGSDLIQAGRWMDTAIAGLGWYLKCSLECYNITQGWQQIHWNMTKGREKYTETSQVLFCLVHIKYPFISCQAMWDQTLQEVAHDTSKAQVQPPPPACHSLSPPPQHHPCLPPTKEGVKRFNTLGPCTSTEEEPFVGADTDAMDSPSEKLPINLLSQVLLPRAITWKSQ